MTDRSITTWTKHAPLARTLGKYLHQIVGYVVRCSWSHVDRCRPNSVVGQLTVFNITKKESRLDENLCISFNLTYYSARFLHINFPKLIQNFSSKPQERLSSPMECRYACQRCRREAAHQAQNRHQFSAADSRTPCTCPQEHLIIVRGLTQQQWRDSKTSLSLIQLGGAATENPHCTFPKKFHFLTQNGVISEFALSRLECMIAVVKQTGKSPP
jgi:hypothetical protein